MPTLTPTQTEIIQEPGLWDVYLSIGDYYSMEEELLATPLGQVRLAQLLFYRGDQHHMRAHALLTSIPIDVAPVRGMALMLMARQHRYDEILATQYQVAGGSPLQREEAAWVHTAKGTAATELGLNALAFAHLQTAAGFAASAGMGRHEDHVRSNALRLQTLCGLADIEALGRHADREGQQPVTRAWNISLLAEGLASYGLYRQAHTALRGVEDPDSRAQRAFYGALLQRPQGVLDEAAARTGYGRLASALRIMQAVGAGTIRPDFELLDLSSEPERTYAWLLTAAAETLCGGSGPNSAMRLLSGPLPDPLDQRLYVLALRLRAVMKGADVPDRPYDLVLDVQETLRLLEQRSGAYEVLETLSSLPSTVMLMGLLPNPHPLVGPRLQEIPQLAGSTIRYLGREYPLTVGKSGGWGKCLVCEALKMDVSGERLNRVARAHYQEQLTLYQGGAPFFKTAPVNLGEVAQLLLKFRRQELESGRPVEADACMQAYERVAALLTPDVRKLLKAHPPLFLLG